MGRRALLLIASILVAATGTGVVALYAKSADDRAGNRQSAVEVLVAKQSIDVSTKSEDLGGLVEKQSFPGAFVPGDAVKNLDQLQGLVATTTIAAGRPLQVSLFGKPGAASTTPNVLPLEKDRVAVSIALPDNARVAGYVLDGSYVALYVLTGGTEAGARGEVRPLLNRPVRVLKIAAYNAPGPTAGQTLVTLELSLAEAPRIIFASQKDQLYMALLPSKDTSVQNAPPFNGVYSGGSD
jgi:Flp pilus assembly protein CpaB